MKKTMRGALCVLSAVTMAAAGTINAAAGALSKEELILKYAPDGAYSADEVYCRPGTEPTYLDSKGSATDIIGEAQAEMDRIQAGVAGGILTDDEISQKSKQLLANAMDKMNSANATVYCYNDCRRGMDKLQWFVGAEYADGFWYVLRTDGTASIVGADQAYFAGKTTLQIPTELNGVTVTRIENRAFEGLSMYLEDVCEIILSETVEEIGEAAFSYALTASDSSIQLVEGVKKIEKLAFSDCGQFLADEWGVIIIPKSVEFIGKRVFSTDDEGKYPALPPYGIQPNPHLILDMPSSLVLIENDDLEQSYSSWLTSDSAAWNLVRNVTVADLKPGSSEELDAFLKWDNEIYYEIYVKPFLDGTKAYDSESYRDAALCQLMLKSEDAPLSALCRQLLELGNYILYDDITNTYTAWGYDSLLGFSEAYDMTRQPVFPKYGLNEHLISMSFLYDEINAIDLGDVAAYYSMHAVAAKPAIDAEPSPMLGNGDADNNGTVDISDAVLLARYIVADPDAIITDAGKVNADINGDGKLNSDDVLAIQKMIAGL